MVWSERSRAAVVSVVRQARSENLPFMAGSIAYQAFVSLLPLLVLVFFVVSVVGDARLFVELIRLTDSLLPPSGERLVYNALTESTGLTRLTLLGTVTLIWASLRVFYGLETAFAAIYDVEGDRSALAVVADAAVVLLALGLALATAGVVGFVPLPVAHPLLGAALKQVALTLGLAVAFLPMYYVFPDVDLGLRQAIPGALLAAVGWSVSKAGFVVYVELAGGSVENPTTLLGGLLLLAVWLYASSFALLLGAVLNAVLAGRASSATAIGSPGRASTNREFATSATLPRAAVADHLADLGASLDGDGPVTLSVDGEEVTLQPGEEVEFELRVLERSPALGGEHEGIVVRAQWEEE